MHTERIHVEASLIGALIKALEEGRPVIAVGTTSVRTIESLPYLGYISRTADISNPCQMHLNQWEAYDDEMRRIPTLQLLRDLQDSLQKAGLDSFTASTAIMIAPGYDWRIVRGMITNFHQPQSTLLLLVSSFLESNIDKRYASYNHWHKIYEEALEKEYRFLSYGDSCLLFPLTT